MGKLTLPVFNLPRFNRASRSVRFWGMTALALGVAACSAPREMASPESFTFLPAYLPGWEAYEVIDAAAFPLPAGELTPFILAQSLLEEPETWECFQVTQVRTEALGDNAMAVLVTEVGLCDDSVAAIEQRIDLTSTAGGWTVAQVGRRFGCARPEFAWAEPGTLCP